MLKPILAILIFLLLQAAGGIILGCLGQFTPIPPFHPTLLALTVIISGLISVLIIYWMEMIDGRHLFSTQLIRWRHAPIALAGALTGIFATDMFTELFQLPDHLADQFRDMAQNPWGILCIALVGPVVEEIVFREAVLGYMLRQGIRPLTAILCSSLAFGLVHGNPVQIPFATIIGCIFAIIYYKTHSILLTTILHIINNSAAVVQMNILGDQAETFRYADLFGTTLLWIFAILLTAVSFCLMRHFCSLNASDQITPITSCTPPTENA